MGDQDGLANARYIFDVDHASVAFDVRGAEGGRRTVLDELSFSVREGEFVGIVGRSGTGKTTLLRILSGLLPCTSGSVSLDGRALHGPPDGVVVVFQDYSNALLPWRTVERNVSLGLERRFSRAERRERIREALQMVSLSGRESDHPRQLSGGMQQRVQIARALALRPRVLLMDEPFGALDAMTKATLQDELLSLQERSGCTIIFITHDIDEAVYLSDRVFVISGAPGRITDEVITDLPRPRNQLSTREMPRYLELRHHLTEALREKAGA